jgi:uncharacterized phage protein (TIGR02216 family)
MAVGLGILKLAPGDLWSATPREIAAAVRGLGGRWGHVEAPERPALDTLMRRFPD